MILRPGEPLAPLGSDLVELIGRSDRFTALAAQLLDEGLQIIGRTALEQEVAAGLGISWPVLSTRPWCCWPIAPS